MKEIKINPATQLLIETLSKKYTQSEIGGYLIGEVKSGIIYIDDILIPSQSVSKSHVTISGREQIQLRKDYGKMCLRIIGHWHSHNDMGAFFSSTDEKLISDFSSRRKLTVFIVTSSGNHKIRVIQRDPVYLVDNDFELSCDSERYQQNMSIAEKIFENSNNSNINIASFDYEDVNNDARDVGESSEHKVILRHCEKCGKFLSAERSKISNLGARSRYCESCEKDEYAEVGSGWRYDSSVDYSKNTLLGGVDL